MDKHAWSLLVTVFLFGSILLGGVPATAEIYRWIDPHGVISFSDTPPVGKRFRKLVPLHEIAGVPVGEHVEASTPATVTAPPSATDAAGGDGAVAEQTSEPTTRATR